MRPIVQKTHLRAVLKKRQRVSLLIPRHMAMTLVISACCLASPLGALAQVNPEIANCSELKDEATITQADLCSAHIGCRFVLNVQKTCARAKSYLQRLQDAIGEGTNTLFGLRPRKEVTPDAVFTAVLNGDDWQKQRGLGGYTKAQKAAEEIAASVREVGNGDVLTGSSDRGARNWVYYGKTSGGKADGMGTRIYSDGEIQRGQTENDTLVGAGEVLSKSGSRFVGKYSSLGSGQREGTEVEPDGSWFNGIRSGNGATNGVYTRPDGTYFMGQRDPQGARLQGRESRANDSLVEEGRYEGNVLSVGARYDTPGVRTEVNLPAAREAAARAAAEQKRLTAEAEQQRKREQLVQAEQQFRSSLQTMNAGQLFAKADELKAKGEMALAREVQRVLISRFPNHALAATAARQMAGDSGASATETLPTGRPSSSAAGSQVSLSDCPAERDALVRSWRESNMTEERSKKMLADVVADTNTVDRTRGLEYMKNYQDVANKFGGSYPPANYSICLIKVRLSRLSSSPAAAMADSGPVAPGGSTGRLSSQACASMKQAVSTARVPAGASVTASTETVMFMTKTAIDMIDGGCTGVGVDRVSAQQSYKAAEDACNAVQSGGRRCVPRAH